MEDDNLIKIFQEYDPELSSSLAFMERLERNLDAVEMIHQENANVMKRNRIAVAVAACAGFIAGMLSSLLIPYLTDWIQSIIATIPGVIGQNLNSGSPYIVSWLVIGALSVFVAVNAYDIALSLQLSRYGKQGD